MSDGIKCPSCSGKSMVVDSRPHKKGIKRRRSCECGHRFSTLETVLKEVVKASVARPPSGKRMLHKMDLPLTYLTAEQKVRARAFFAAGWTVKEVGKLYDMTPLEMRK